jgi:hypothetical protein
MPPQDDVADTSGVTDDVPREVGEDPRAIRKRAFLDVAILGEDLEVDHLALPNASVEFRDRKCFAQGHLCWLATRNDGISEWG